jgi:hypothetical protein
MHSADRTCVSPHARMSYHVSSHRNTRTRTLFSHSAKVISLSLLEGVAAFSIDSFNPRGPVVMDADGNSYVSWTGSGQVGRISHHSRAQAGLGVAMTTESGDEHVGTLQYACSASACTNDRAECPCAVLNAISCDMEQGRS